ncbi:MAG: GNAT family N-acetyltransferase [Verrucomicrobia bacterium]|nr:GNAT family N-acetyltransferase [Verrucomicrobiota bacterium]
MIKDNCPATPNIDGPRACRKEEISEVIGLVDGEMRRGTDQSLLTDYPLVYRDENLENIFILKAGGALASVVPFIPKTVRMDGCEFTIGIISPTVTNPGHRKKGCALQCLDACIRKMEAAGIDLSVLWTKVETFPFYEKREYQGVQSQGWIYPCLGRDADLLADHGEAIVEYDPKTRQYLREIHAIHEQEHFGILRSPDEYAVLLNLPKMKTLIALRNGIPTGYLVVSKALNKPGLLEAGGEESAVETLVKRALLKESVRDETRLGN